MLLLLGLILGALPLIAVVVLLGRYLWRHRAVGKADGSKEESLGLAVKAGGSHGQIDEVNATDEGLEEQVELGESGEIVGGRG